MVYMTNKVPVQIFIKFFRYCVQLPEVKNVAIHVNLTALNEADVIFVVVSVVSFSKALICHEVGCVLRDSNFEYSVPVVLLIHNVFYVLISSSPNRQYDERFLL